MKKLVCSLAALFAFGIASAQETTTASEGFKQGDAFISGSVGVSTQKNGDLKASSFNVSPSVGYFVNNNIALGVSLGYNHSNQDYRDVTVDYERKTSTFTAGVFGRYYLMPASKFSVFGQLGVNYATSKATIERFDSEDTYNTFGVLIAPGINYFISDHFALEATFGLLSYTTAKPDVDYDIDSTDTFNFGLNLSNINFGLIYKF